jgi:hypothetical protein
VGKIILFGTFVEVDTVEWPYICTGNLGSSLIMALKSPESIVLFTHNQNDLRPLMRPYLKLSFKPSTFDWQATRVTEKLKPGFVCGAAMGQQQNV